MATEIEAPQHHRAFPGLEQRLLAGPFELLATRGTDDKLMFTMTFNGEMRAAMSEETAVMFANFVESALTWTRLRAAPSPVVRHRSPCTRPDCEWPFCQPGTDTTLCRKSE